MDTKSTSTKESPCGVLTASENDFFKHEPLDHSKASIRLLEVRTDLSRDGLVQCSLIHTAIGKTPYNCLSYRWGEPSPTFTISMNGRPYRVGKNLYDFLSTFRRLKMNQAAGYLWIDALCIAQDNVLERNHQVKQMGDVYSKAQLVFVWLGSMLQVAATIRSLKKRQSSALKDLGVIRLDLLSRHLYNNEYWDRAWITQEFLLARRAIGLFGNEPVDFSDLLSSMKSSFLLADGRFKSSSFSQHILHKYEGHTATVEPTLVSLISRFRGKLCALPQDRIFSLLSLCSLSSRVEVDYNQDAATLASKVLAHVPQPQCLCDFITLLHALDFFVDPWTKSLNESDRRFRNLDGVFIEIDLEGVQLLPGLYPQLLYGGNICPVVEEIILSCMIQANTWHSATAISAQDIPFFFHRLGPDKARKLIQNGSSIFDIKATEPASRKYTLRIRAQSILNEDVKLRGQCPVSERGAKWSKVRNESKKVAKFTPRHLWNVWSLSEHAKLREQGSFESYSLVYSMLEYDIEHAYEHAWEYTWGGRSREKASHLFLLDLGKYMQGGDTTLELSRMEEAIRKAKISVPNCSWGPCRFVCSRDE